MSKSSGLFGGIPFQALVGLAFVSGLTAWCDGQERDDRRELLAEGHALFVKEWTPGAPSQHGGDGRGPVYNDTSCVACHNLGGTGGAGPLNKNVDLLTASITPSDDKIPDGPLKDLQLHRRQLTSALTQRFEDAPKPSPKGSGPDRAPLIKLHSGFRDSPSVLVHLFGTDREYEDWHLAILQPEIGRTVARTRRFFGPEHSAQLSTGPQRALSRLPVEYGDFTLVRTQLNPSPLFGEGLIDSIPDWVIEDAARPKGGGFSAVKGRVRRLEDGRIGRFGWKAQSATLDDFVLTACAVELGLEVPGHPQSLDPRMKVSTAPGLDLTRTECDALTAFVASLPAPVMRMPEERADAQRVLAGRARFDAIGCSNCHTARLGEVDGIYSDLLLHDMGDQLSDSGSYSSFLPSSSSEDEDSTGIMPNGPMAFHGAKPRFRAPTRREWRTPPLWGVRDSGPYLHDGRAETLEQAIALHGGQAASSKTSYFRLPQRERQSVEVFLKSLVAPPPAAVNAPRRPGGVPRQDPSGEGAARYISRG